MTSPHVDRSCLSCFDLRASQQRMDREFARVVRELPDAYGGVTIAVAQCDWGHVARKRSWIYMVGVRAIGVLPPRREPTHWVSGGRGRDEATGRRHTRVPDGIRVCSAQQRRRTPVAFAEWLLSLAAQARRGVAA